VTSDLDPLQAVVFDMDGVVTRTAAVHRQAWKVLFDDLLASRPATAGEDHRPFSEADYRAHVDGKPRHDGLRDFLAARGIVVPEGDAGDPPQADTVRGLGQRKNRIFRELLHRHGVDVDEAAVSLARALRKRGIRVGVATSSENGGFVLQTAGIQTLFEARVDGVVRRELGLRGKPDPDIFVECARRLGAESPARAIVVEDARSGVIAARAGGFGLVVGLDRARDRLALREAGADLVVADMAELTADRILALWRARVHARPNLLREWARVEPTFRGRRLAVFLDYDGTLTPIVDRPELAVLDPAMQRTLEDVARRWPTFVVSGRALDDIRRLVGIDALWYAGSHGFDIASPRGTLASHQVAAEHPGLREGHGKKVFPVRPAIDWDKGRALLWMLDAAGLADAFPIFVGDDITDEDAFAVLAEQGLPVLVTDMPRPTAARHSLQDPVEVQLVLQRLAAAPEPGVP
jgi:alpha,alpha-trehalase